MFRPYRTACAIALAASTAFAGMAWAAEKSAPPEPFTEEYMHDDANVAAGKEIWDHQCRHCHGAKAYPGKAPKLRPRRYKPEFIYSRVTDGFRKMPAWKEVYTDVERMQITTYVLSDKFSP